MLGVQNIIDHLQSGFQGEFKNARFRGIGEDLDLSQQNFSDLVIVPNDFVSPRAFTDRVTQNRDGLTLGKDYIAFFLFTRKIDVVKSLRAIISRMVDSPNQKIEIIGCELNERNILKTYFSNKGVNTDSVTLIGLRFRISFFMTLTKAACPICYVDC